MARSTTTVKQILGDARMLAGALNATEITNESLLIRYNLVLPQIYKSLNGALFARFMAHAPLGTPAGYRSEVSSGGTQTYTASTKKITLSTALASSAVGGLCFFRDDDAGLGYFSTITAYSSTDFTVADGPASNIGSGDLSYILLLPPSATSHSIQEYRIDKLKRVVFATGLGREVDEDVIEALSGIPTDETTNAYTHTGTGGNATVKVFAGSQTVNNGGFPVVFFEELPARVTAVTEYVDLPSEYHSVLTKEIARLTLVQSGMNVPTSLSDPMQTLDAITEAYLATQG